MKSFLRNLIGIIVGLFVGAYTNMGLIYLGPKLIAPPNGADITSEAGLRATIHLFEPKHFLFPFLAHAIGTLVGATIALLISKDRKSLNAYIVGLMFLIGGTMMVFSLPSPMWFNIIDLVFAYIPMAILATIIIRKK